MVRIFRTESILQGSRIMCRISPTACLTYFGILQSVMSQTFANLAFQRTIVANQAWIVRWLFLLMTTRAAGSAKQNSKLNRWFKLLWLAGVIAVSDLVACNVVFAKAHKR